MTTRPSQPIQPVQPVQPVQPAQPDQAAPLALSAGVFDQANRADPYPIFRAIREAGASHWLAASARMIALTRHADCQRVLSDPAFGHLPPSESSYREGPDEGLRSMMRANPPTHTRLRRLVSRAFTPGRVARFEPLARDLTAELLDDAVGRDEVDLVGGLTRPVPLRVICTLLGVPAADEKVFSDWASALARAADPIQTVTLEERAARTAGNRGFTAYFTDLITTRRAEPRDDLLSDLIAVQEQGDSLSDQELVELGELLLVAGYETTVNLVAHAVLALARDPEQYAALRARPDLVTSAVEEALRYDPPIQLVLRSALTEVEIAGQSLRRGDGVVLLIPAATRDPDVFADPDRFDVTRYAGPTQP
ncbi:cytochrome P450, partial [Frankia canadensis]|uniref:cytochrome P450 n=1 Tax=Frankia canadensis TaxID=1836972 RepID=UPI000C7A31E1